MNIKQKLDKIIYDQIMDSILLGEYKMGEQIHIDSLAEKFGVSRTPVVQATKLLANDGILEILKTGRVRIPVFTSDEIKKICNIRSLVENYAVDEMFAIENDDAFEERCKLLDEIAETGLQQNSQNDKLSYNKTDLHFHITLVEGSDNDLLVTLYKQIQGRFVVANFLSNSWSNMSITASANAHKDIVNALYSKDKELCKQILTNHIQMVSDHV